MHTAWRSRGTWAWEALRAQPGNLGFYEPLHEQLPAISTRRIRRLHNRNWQSGHPEMARPYFAEYAPLLRPSPMPGYCRYLPLADDDFAFGRYFLRPESRHDALRRYVDSLCAAAARTGCRPVMKFARSQGRLPWFAANFRDVEHILLVRQPWAQFCSGWRCFAGDHNPYFVAAPFMVLERNADHPDVAALIRALKLPIAAPGRQERPLRRLKHWIRSTWHIEPIILYRPMFALWLLSLVTALTHAETVLDADDAAAVAGRLAITLSRQKAPRATASTAAPDISLVAIKLCHETAWRVSSHLIGTVARQRLRDWIAAAEAQASVMLTMPQPALPAAPIPPLFAGISAQHGP